MRRAFILAALTAWLAAPSVLWAMEAGPVDEQVVRMPDRWQAGFTIAVFIVLVIVLGAFAFKPILQALQNREKYIRDSLASAKRDRDEAEARLKELMEKLDHARHEAGVIVDEGRRDAEAVKRRIEDEARRNAEALIERAKREIGIARDTALRDLHEESAKLAMDMAGAVLKRQLAPEDHRRLVGEALARLKEQGGGSRN